MTSQPHASELARRSVYDEDLPAAAWWPQNRMLSDQLQHLVAQWPDDAGRIARVLYSPPDWDDHPRTVQVPGRRVKMGSFPHDDTHQLVLTLLNRQRRTVTVIPPDTDVRLARTILDGFAAGPAA